MKFKFKRFQTKQTTTDFLVSQGLYKNPSRTKNYIPKIKRKYNTNPFNRFLKQSGFTNAERVINRTYKKVKNTAKAFNKLKGANLLSNIRQSTMRELSKLSKKKTLKSEQLKLVINEIDKRKGINEETRSGLFINPNTFNSRKESRQRNRDIKEIDGDKAKQMIEMGGEIFELQQNTSSGQYGYIINWNGEIFIVSDIESLK